MKSNSFTNTNKTEGDLVFYHYVTFTLWLWLSAIIVTDLWLTKNPSYAINVILIMFLASLIFLYSSSYFKIKHAVLFNLRLLKPVSNIDLEKCLFIIKRTAIAEEMLKVNFMNIVILIIMEINHALTYRNIHINSLHFLTAISIQMYCHLRLIKLKSIQATFYFPEAKQAYQVKLSKQKKLAEAEKHLPWLKRTF